MKKFIEVSLFLAVVLLTPSLSWGQDHFQTGDVFAGIGNGQIRWYRGGTILHTLSVGTSTFDTGMAFDAASNLYATDFSLGEVSKFDMHGNASLFAGDFGAVSPESLVFDSTGNLFVGDANGTSTESGRIATIWKLSASGNLLTSFTVAAENRGADWVDLAADQKTIFYTSEGTTIKRFDTSTNKPLSDFASGLPGGTAFALKILPNGNVLVADTSEVLQLNTSGVIIHIYNPCGDGTCSGLFSLNLDPDGLHFWVGDSTTGNIYEIRIADAGTVVDQTILTGVLPGTGTSGLFGVAVFGEITSSNTRNLVFTPSATPETQIATIGNPGDPNAQSLALTLQSVADPPINVSVTFFYEPTDVSTGTHAVGIADGDCENGATEATDFDCRFVPDFVYPPGPNLPAGDKLVPHIIPSHDNLGVWVRVKATLLDGSPAVAGTDYNLKGGFVDWYYAWNTNPLLAAPPPTANYIAGWNNSNPQLYDRPGEISDIAFVANITTFSKTCTPPNCVGKADPGTGGRTKTLNDVVVAAPPNPATGGQDTVELLVPEQGSSPFQYLKNLPMLVSFELENKSTDKSDPTALTSPHSVTVATLDPNGTPIDVQYPAGFPMTFTYNPFFKAYYIFLSPAPYKTDGTVYTLQIDSDLFPKPVSVNFVVKNFRF